MIKRLLIANRGEIACRIIRSAHAMGIRTVAVYSEADADAMHVRMADSARLIGPASASESYLVIEKIIAAAKAEGADAIHPGYGFLSERAEFADACAEAGLIFVGPAAASIRSMGDKARAKALMGDAGVPLTPGYHGADQSDDLLAVEAAKIGFPVLVKASAGGGGRGMRIVLAADELQSAMDAARREAKSAFGDDTLLLERYLDRPRHVEVQVMADSHGNVLHLHERDCSIQRRHQKVIEEAPAPNLRPETRKQLTDAAVAAAKAINYVGAGTCEFLVDQDGNPYFIEMNTRIQVEHPVTEMITGLDLIEMQLRVAGGEALALTQDQVECNGHAVEARLYAEDPNRGFLPQTGRLAAFDVPANPGRIRVDTGVAAGDAISVHYDPMIAKVIAWAETRELAARELTAALAGTAIAGLTTNIDFLGNNMITGRTINIDNTSPASNSAVLLAAGTRFISTGPGFSIVSHSDVFRNFAGASAFQTTNSNGQFIIYTNGGTGDIFGGLAGGTIIGASFEDNQPETLSFDGNIFYTITSNLSWGAPRPVETVLEAVPLEVNTTGAGQAAPTNEGCGSVAGCDAIDVQAMLNIGQ